MIATLLLTLTRSFIAQVNALTLQYTVDRINQLIEADFGLSNGWHLLIPSTAIILPGKKSLMLLFSLDKNFMVKSYTFLDLAQGMIEKFLTDRLAFFKENHLEKQPLFHHQNCVRGV